MSRRAWTAAGILLAWLVGMGALAHREWFKGRDERLAQAALLVQPATHYYAVVQGATQMGFARSILDTTPRGILASEFLVADLAAHRAAARVDVNLTRHLTLSSFRLELGADLGPFLAIGTMSGDSVLTVVTNIGKAPPDTQVTRLTAPLLLPSVVPLQIALVDEPAVGRVYRYSVYDPGRMAVTDLVVRVRAESLLVVPDSAMQLQPRTPWVAAHLDTLRAWLLQPEGGSSWAVGSIAGWMDEKGRMVDATQMATVDVRRTAYEMAYENWSRLGARARAAATREDRPIVSATVIAASRPLGDAQQRSHLAVRLTNAPLGGFDLDGGRQRLSHDTLLVTREPDDSLVANYTLPMAVPGRYANELAAEPLVEKDDSAMVVLAMRIADGATDPRVVAQRLAAWVHDSITKAVALTMPDAMQVLRTRRGDAGEHSALLIALARAVGLPARGAAGLVWVGGKYYEHAWVELYLGRWVAVDPTFGQFPADASHLRFLLGGYRRQAELLRLMDNLRIDVLSSD